MTQNRTVEMTSFQKEIKPRHFQQTLEYFFIPHKSAVRMAHKIS